MKTTSRRMAAAVLISCGCASAAAQPAPGQSKCKAVQAEMTESRATIGCKPEHSSCFLGEVDGNNGLRGTTYFKGEASVAAPSESPGFIAYSGVFEYVTQRGTLVARETGVVNQTKDTADSGAITAYQSITGASGELEGATGHFFVNGFSRDGRIVTKVTGRLCRN